MSDSLAACGKARSTWIVSLDVELDEATDADLIPTSRALTIWGNGRLLLGDCSRGSDAEGC